MASATSIRSGKAEARVGDAGAGRRAAWLVLAFVLAAALGLRLWGVGSGLPYVYNVDEAAHFVPRAVAMSWSGLDPRYFVNPPALTYVLHVLFSVWFGGARGVVNAYVHHRADVFLLARVAVALLGTLAVWLLYLVGARLFGDRCIGLLAAALEGVAFLPVFYGHFALNDAATLAPLTLSLLGSVLVMVRGRARHYALAGAGLGVACATKYTAGIVLLPLLAAAWIRYRGELSPYGTNGPVEDGGERPARRGAAPARRALLCIALAGAAALAAFLLANPYALLDFHRFRAELAHQSALTAEAQGKLGAPRESGLLYYAWSLTWGLGWLPSLAALGGALAIWRRQSRAGWLLVPPLVAFGVFMGVQSRYFGRWLLPAFPFLCLLAAWFALEAVRVLFSQAHHLRARLGATSGAGFGASLRASHRAGWAARPGARRGGTTRVPLGAAAMALAAVALLGQGVVYSVHDDLVLVRPDTLASARAWMVAHVPRGARIVLEPIVRDEWLQEGGPGPARTHPDRWSKYPGLGQLVSSSGTLSAGGPQATKIEEYELTLAPALVGRYERAGYCWIVSGSTQFGRALASPSRARWALAYYRALRARAQTVYRISPYARGSTPPSFSFDWSFDYYPLAYARAGPEVIVYRLHGGRCAR